MTGRTAERRPSADERHASPAIRLHLDELIAMRGRRASFGRNRAVEGFRFGDLSSRRRGTGLELDNIGPYQWGDDIRHMDWFATARTGRPQVKQFRQDVQQTIIIVLDLRPSMLFGSKTALMAKIACLASARLAWATSKDHQPLGLLIAGHDRSVEFIPPRRGRRARLQHLARIVDAYQRALQHVGKPSPALDDMLHDLPRHMAGDVEAVIVSDFSKLGADFDQRIREAGARGTLSAVVIEDELMTSPPPPGHYPIGNVEGDGIVTVAIRKRDANLYKGRIEAHRQALTAHLLSLGMSDVLLADAHSLHEGYFR